MFIGWPSTPLSSPNGRRKIARSRQAEWHLPTYVDRIRRLRRAKMGARLSNNEGPAFARQLSPDRLGHGRKTLGTLLSLVLVAGLAVNAAGPARADDAIVAPTISVGLADQI